MITVVESAIKSVIKNSAIEPLTGIISEGTVETDSLDLRYQLNDYLVVQLKRNTEDLIGRINERGCI